MSIVLTKKDADNQVTAVLMRANYDPKTKEIMDSEAEYAPDERTKDVRAMILKHFTLGSVTMEMPRVEFNDLSVRSRDQFDQMAWNTYQPNNGESYQADQINSWRSNAVRPVVRNKAVSIAAHATARLLFPKIFAYDSDSKRQGDAAQVMEDLMEWAGEESNYAYTALQRVITALYSPASIGYTEYQEIYRTVKTEKNDKGEWIEKKILDKAFPCFADQVVPVDQFYIENFFEPDLQKQGWILLRKVYGFSLAQMKYAETYDNFKYVRPGVQTVYDDANRNFYYVYDPNMRQEDIEEITYWNRSLDLKIIMVNGIMLTECDNPNPRIDKLYPFDKFGYELINTKCFYYKSLAFKLMHDADILNTLYQMIIDGTYLSIFRPMVNVGGEMISSDVIVPGAVTTLSDPNADLRAINLNSDLKSGMETLTAVENSVNESSQGPEQAGQPDNSSQTAYEISRLEQNANTVLGLFIQMIAKHVKDFGNLRLGDIIQYMTLPDVGEITDDPELVYRTFIVADKRSGGNGKSKKIKFDSSLPSDPIDSKTKMGLSYDVLEEEKQEEGTEIYKVNPALFRDLTYMVTVSPDVLNPRSEDLMRAYDLETYDKMIMDPSHDPEETYRLLLSTNPKTKRNPDKYITKGQPQQAGQMPQPGQGQSQKPQTSSANALPQAMSAGQLR